MLNRKTYYGLQALLFLARNVDSSSVAINSIAQSLEISRKFLEKILVELGSEGLVSSKKGRSGGYFISKKLNNISLADVVRILEGPIALLPCASHRFYEPCKECKSPDQCSLQDALVNVRNSTVHSLKSIKISDILLKEEKLNRGILKPQRPIPFKEK